MRPDASLTLDAALVDLSRHLLLSEDATLVIEGHEIDPKQATTRLTDYIYSRYFQRRRKWEKQSTRLSGDGGWVLHLSYATHGACRYEDGFQVLKAGPDWAFVSNGTINLFLDEPEQFLPTEARVLDKVSVRMPRARDNWMPRRFTLYGAHGPCDVRKRFSKLTFSLEVEGAAALVELLSGPKFGAFSYSLYVGNEPRDLARADAVVLDVAERDEEKLLHALEPFWKAHALRTDLGGPVESGERKAGLYRWVGEGKADAADGGFWRRAGQISDAVFRALLALETSPQEWRARIVEPRRLP